jgi:hypothetical protein
MLRRIELLPSFGDIFMAKILSADDIAGISGSIFEPDV